MRKLHFVAILLALCCCITVAAKEYKVEDVPMVHLMDRTRYVSNPDNTPHFFHWSRRQEYRFL